jgi:hypothetical protein
MNTICRYEDLELYCYELENQKSELTKQFQYRFQSLQRHIQVNKLLNHLIHSKGGIGRSDIKVYGRTSSVLYLLLVSSLPASLLLPISFISRASLLSFLAVFLLCRS